MWAHKIKRKERRKSFLLSTTQGIDCNLEVRSVFVSVCRCLEHKSDIHLSCLLMKQVFEGERERLAHGKRHVLADLSSLWLLLLLLRSSEI